MKRFCARLADLKLWSFVWALFVLLLPLTSVPIITRLAHSDVVAAPSALLLPVLLLGWGLPRLICGKRLPEHAFPLILFVIAALFSTAVSFFYQIPDFKGSDPLRGSVSAVLTLFIGFCFYLVSLLFHDSEDRMRFTFKLLSVSGAVICIWTLTQAFFWFRDQRYPAWMRTIQDAVSVGGLYRQRFNGFTLEPSWLAHQMNLLYLPFWFAASVSGYSAFSKRLGFITVERVLFGVGVLVLFLTLSRVGLAAFLITAAFCFLVFVHRLIRRFAGAFAPEKRRWIAILAYFGVIVILAGAAYGILRFLMKMDFRMAGLFEIEFIGRSDAVFYLAEKLSLAPRFVYWDGGYTIFNAYPILGVGLGHAGFYLPQSLNDYAFKLVEVRDLLFRSNTLLNIKSLWVRVLAETGIIGFILFFVWYLRSLLGNMLSLGTKDQLKSAAAWMGCFTLLAFLLEGFSLDTFALPYLWFSVGLAAAAAEMAH